MRLEYEDILDYKQWHSRMMTLSWGCVALVLLVELCVFLFGYDAIGTAFSKKTYAYIFILRPTIVNIATLTVIALVSNSLIATERFTAQAFVYVTGITFMCFFLAATHNTVPALSCIFVFPLLISLTYIDKQILNYAFTVSISAYCVFVVLLIFKLLGPTSALPEITNLASALTLICVVFLASRLGLKRQQSIITGIFDKNVQSKVDNFTKLYNHAAFYEQLDEHIIRFNKSGQQFNVILMDLDDFKQINDQLGHQIGDEVLMVCVGAIRRNISETDFAFRYGGEEFAVLTTRDTLDTFNLSEKIRRSFANRTKARPDIDRMVTLSSGICLYDGKRFGARREFFAAVDEALYKAKRSGKNQTIVWDPKFFDIQPNL